MKEATMNTNVNENQVGGTHYLKCGIQPWDYALANNMDVVAGYVIKYVTRHKEKNGAQDLRKAIHCIEKLIDFYYPDSNNT